MRTLARLLATTAVAALPLLAAGSASAECDAEIVSPTNFSPSVSYDPFDPNGVNASQTVHIENTGDETCTFWLVFHRSPNIGATLNGTLAYGIQGAGVGGANRLSNDPDNVVPSNRQLGFPSQNPGQIGRFNYRIVIDAGQVVPAGSYSDTIELRVFEANTSNLLDRRDLFITANVAAQRSINLAGADVTSPFNHSMDFGTLAQGEFREIQVEVRSNESYRVSFNSEHGGVMKLDGREGWTVPYTVTFGGSGVTLPSNSASFGPTSVSGDSRALRVTIGEVGDRRAGTYRDEITITVEPMP